MNIYEALISNQFVSLQSKAEKRKDEKQIREVVLFSDSITDQPIQNDSKFNCQNSYRAYSIFSNTIGKSKKLPELRMMDSGWYDYTTKNGAVIKYYINKITFNQWVEWKILLYNNGVKYFDGILDFTNKKIVVRSNNSLIENVEVTFNEKNELVIIPIERKRPDIDYTYITNLYKDNSKKNNSKKED